MVEEFRKTKNFIMFFVRVKVENIRELNLRIQSNLRNKKSQDYAFLLETVYVAPKTGKSEIYYQSLRYFQVAPGTTRIILQMPRYYN